MLHVLSVEMIPNVRKRQEVVENQQQQQTPNSGVLPQLSF